MTTVCDVVRRPVLALLVGVLALMASGCEVRTAIDVDAERDGSGVVEVILSLDDEAARTVPDLAQQLRRDDLTAAGWQVDGPVASDDGRTEITVRHDFGAPEEVQPLLAQVGPAFGGLSLTQRRSVTNVESSFSGAVDLQKGVESFGDDGMRARTGAALGFDAEELRAALALDWARTLPVSLAVRLPGGDKGETPDRNAEGAWPLALGALTPVSVDAQGLNTLPVALFGVAIFLLMIALLIAALWTSSVYRPRHRRRPGGVRARDLLARS